MPARDDAFARSRPVTEGAVAEDAVLRYLRPSLPYALPPFGAPLRIAFVGQRTYFEACSLQDATADLDPAFVEFRHGADAAAVGRKLFEFRPHVVVAFRPEWYPPGTFDAIRAPVVGFLTEPLPVPGEEPHPDLERRLADLAAIAPSGFDRLVVFDPRIAASLGRLARTWRSCPLPVSDRLFRAPRPPSRPLCFGFLGRSTPHRETFLEPLKHHFELLHVAHGISGERLEGFLDEIDVALNLHNEPYRTFENRVALHLASGQLVLSEPLTPTHGLEAGLDFLEVATPTEAFETAVLVDRVPDVYAPLRHRGRMKAEYFRASRTYRRLVHDLLVDLAVYGTRVEGSSAEVGGSPAAPDSAPDPPPPGGSPGQGPPGSDG